MKTGITTVHTEKHTMMMATTITIVTTTITVHISAHQDKQKREIAEPSNTRHQHEAAFQVGKLLIEAYRRGEARCGSIDWDELDQAYQALAAHAVSEAKKNENFAERNSAVSIEIGSGSTNPIASFVPITAPLTMPMRMVRGDVGWLPGVLSVAVMLLATYGMIRLAAHVFRAGIIRVGVKLKWRETLRIGR